MEYFGHTKLSLVLFSLLTLSACSDTGDESNKDQARDSRSTISAFLQDKTEDIVLSSTTEINENIKFSINKASISFTNYLISNLSENSVVVPWPMLSTLPLVTAATNGDTYDEVILGLSDFGLEQSWSSAIGVLQQNLSPLTKSDTTQYSHHFWWQEDSLFEADFLSQINSALRPEHSYNNFKNYESISENLYEAVTQSYGTDYLFSLEKYANTRLVTLNQLKTKGKFDLNNIQAEAFDGIFLDTNENLIKYPMLRFQGTLESYENSDYSAYKIPMADDQLSLISIQPSTNMKTYVLDNMNIILNDLNINWVSKETTTVLPVISVEFQMSDNDWLEWRDIGLIYSEENADLRSMDRFGGLYMQSMPYLNRMTISKEGVELAGVSGHVVTFDDSNLFYSPSPGAGVIYQTGPAPGVLGCVEVEVDLVPSFVVIIDESNGIIQAILSVNSVNGTNVEPCFL